MSSSSSLSPHNFSSTISWQNPDEIAGRRLQEPSDRPVHPSRGRVPLSPRRFRPRRSPLSSHRERRGTRHQSPVAKQFGSKKSKCSADLFHFHAFIKVWLFVLVLIFLRRLVL